MLKTRDGMAAARCPLGHRRQAQGHGIAFPRPRTESSKNTSKRWRDFARALLCRRHPLTLASGRCRARRLARNKRTRAMLESFSRILPRWRSLKHSSIRCAAEFTASSVCARPLHGWRAISCAGLRQGTAGFDAWCAGAQCDSRSGMRPERFDPARTSSRRCGLGLGRRYGRVAMPPFAGDRPFGRQSPHLDPCAVGRNARVLEGPARAGEGWPTRGRGGCGFSRQA